MERRRDFQGYVNMWMSYHRDLNLEDSDYHYTLIVGKIRSWEIVMALLPEIKISKFIVIRDEKPC